MCTFSKMSIRCPFKQTWCHLFDMETITLKNELPTEVSCFVPWYTMPPSMEGHLTTQGWHSITRRLVVTDYYYQTCGSIYLYRIACCCHLQFDLNMNEQMERWLNGWMDGWLDRCIDFSIQIIFAIQTTSTYSLQSYFDHNRLNLSLTNSIEYETKLMERHK